MPGLHTFSITADITFAGVVAHITGATELVALAEGIGAVITIALVGIWLERLSSLTRSQVAHSSDGVRLNLAPFAGKGTGSKERSDSENLGAHLDLFCLSKEKARYFKGK